MCCKVAKIFGVFVLDMEKRCNFAASKKTNGSFNSWGSRIVAIATDCKSVRVSVRWFESTLPHDKAKFLLRFFRAFCSITRIFQKKQYFLLLH